MARAQSTSIGGLIGDNPCVQCLDPKELWIAIVYLLADANSYTLPDDVSTINTAAACNNCALNETQMLQALVSALWSAYASDKTLAEVREEATCLQCMDTLRLKGLASYLAAKYINTLTTPT